MTGCSSIAKYPNWEFVRIEPSVPASCKYVVQESCPPSALEGCYNWYKKRATTYNANTVVPLDTRLADYYICPKNLGPIRTNSTFKNL